MSEKISINWEMVEREETQKKTFGKWVQFQLSRHPSPSRVDVITDLYYDLRDGHVLLDLLEVIVKPYLDRKDNISTLSNIRGIKPRSGVHAGKENNDIWKREQGILRVHHLANAGCVLNILRDSQHPFSKCVNINSVDIVDGKFDNFHMVSQFYITGTYD